VRVRAGGYSPQRKSFVSSFRVYAARTQSPNRGAAKGIVQNLCYRSSKEFLETDKKRLAGYIARRNLGESQGAAPGGHRIERGRAELTLENRMLKMYE